LRLPRDLSGRELCKLLRRFGYEIKRQEGSHIHLESQYKGSPHSITIPDHDELKIGTLQKILRRVSEYLEIELREMLRQLSEV
jgi:predicted RNA binding protein YcfA (HicA-like mRNA interferase family)